MSLQPEQEQNLLISRLVACDAEIRELRENLMQLEGVARKLKGNCVALGRELSICRRQKAQYFRAVKWLLGNTKLEPAEIPGRVRHTLTHVAEVAAQRAVEGRL